MIIEILQIQTCYLDYQIYLLFINILLVYLWLFFSLKICNYLQTLFPNFQLFVHLFNKQLKL